MQTRSNLLRCLLVGLPFGVFRRTQEASRLGLLAVSLFCPSACCLVFTSESVKPQRVKRLETSRGGGTSECYVVLTPPGLGLPGCFAVLSSGPGDSDPLNGSHPWVRLVGSYERIVRRVLMALRLPALFPKAPTAWIGAGVLDWCRGDIYHTD